VINREDAVDWFLIGASMFMGVAIPLGVIAMLVAVVVGTLKVLGVL